MCGRGNVRSGKCAVGECAVGEMCGRGNVRSGKCAVGELSSTVEGDVVANVFDIPTLFAFPRNNFESLSCGVRKLCHSIISMCLK